jgi:hypothetical protein
MELLERSKTTEMIILRERREDASPKTLALIKRSRERRAVLVPQKKKRSYSSHS